MRLRGPKRETPAETVARVQRRIDRAHTHIAAGVCQWPTCREPERIIRLQKVVEKAQRSLEVFDGSSKPATGGNVPVVSGDTAGPR